MSTHSPYPWRVENIPVASHAVLGANDELVAACETAEDAAEIVRLSRAEPALRNLGRPEQPHD